MQPQPENFDRISPHDLEETITHIVYFKEMVHCDMMKVSHHEKNSSHKNETLVVLVDDGASVGAFTHNVTAPPA